LKKIFLSLSFISTITFGIGFLLLYAPATSFAQSNCVCAYCNRPCDDIAKYGHFKGCPYYVEPASSTNSNTTSSSTSTTTSSSNSNHNSGSTFTNNDAKVMIIGALINAALSSNNTSNADKQKQEAAMLQLQKIAAEKAKQKRIKDSLDQIAYRQLIQMSKTLPDGSADLDFKTLDGNAEKMRKDATDQFTPSISNTPTVNSEIDTTYKNFFGDSLSNIKLQVGEKSLDPKNDTIYKDVSDAVNLSDTLLKNGKLPVVILKQIKIKNNGSPIYEQQQLTCEEIKNKLNKATLDLSKFRDWNQKTKDQMEAWQKEQSDALTASAIEGLKFLITKFTNNVDKKIEKLEKSKEIALNLQKNTKNPVYIDRIEEVVKKYDKCLAILNKEKLPEFVGGTIDALTDYRDVAKSSLILLNQDLTKADAELQTALDETKDEGIFKEDYENDNISFIVLSMVDLFSAPDVGFTIACGDFAINEVLDLGKAGESYYRIIKLQEADGKAKPETIKLEVEIAGYKAQLKRQNCPGASDIDYDYGW
jgi:hypothetical protein